MHGGNIERSQGSHAHHRDCAVFHRQEARLAAHHHQVLGRDRLRIPIQIRMDDRRTVFHSLGMVAEVPVGQRDQEEVDILDWVEGSIPEAEEDQRSDSGSEGEGSLVGVEEGLLECSSGVEDREDKRDQLEGVVFRSPLGVGSSSSSAGSTEEQVSEVSLLLASCARKLK